MKPYFETHAIGLLYYLILLCWYGTEIVHFIWQRQWQNEATHIDQRAYWLAVAGAVIVGITMLFAAPYLVPAAAIGHDALAFGVGIGLLTMGAALRIWSQRTLGRYFAPSVQVSIDQPVVARGPYRVLRHPGYAGGLLAIIGISLLYGNWIGVATLAAFWLVLVLWRIRIEEAALLAALDDRYRSYAARHKRLVPLIW